MSKHQEPLHPNLDSVSTVNADGSHHILHPHDARGAFTFWRRVFGLLVIAVYLALPWIQINGAPAVFLDVAHRRFHLFGITLVPQDLWVLFFGMTGLGFGIFFVTSLFGRVWCGWSCPYTVFLEHIYRRIERFVDGDGPARRRLAEAPMSPKKAVRRLIKWTLYLIASAVLAHTALAYFVSFKEVYSLIGDGPAAHLSTFVAVAALTGIFYFCFAWFREQFCIILCPYGRLQSALSDQDTIIIGYDENRGEPRGKRRKDNPEPVGDCVDCNRCVNVCPTGIDIRNGLQLECIGCAACIDACDTIMGKLDRPKGLIRYDSGTALAGGVRRILRPRVWLYAAFALLGLGVFSAVAFTQAAPVNSAVIRMVGEPYYLDSGVIRNNFEVRMINKRQQPSEFRIELADASSGFTSTPPEGTTFTVPPQGEVKRPFFITIPEADFGGDTPLQIRVIADPGDHEKLHGLRFLGPPQG